MGFLSTPGLRKGIAGAWVWVWGTWNLEAIPLPPHQGPLDALDFQGRTGFDAMPWAEDGRGVGRP